MWMQVPVAYEDGGGDMVAGLKCMFTGKISSKTGL